MARLLLAGLAAAGCHSEAARRPRRPRHPNARPGIDASRVVEAAKLGNDPVARRVFELVREIPEVCDAIRCHCNCAVTLGLRSLLECFEGDGMARDCDLCLKEAERVYRLHKSGHTIQEIRTLVDAAFL